MKAVIFDWDGTVCDTLELCIAALRRAMEPRLGRELTDREVTDAFGPNEEGILQRMVPDDWQNALEDYLVCYEELHRICPEPFAGMRQLLAKLKEKGVVVALVTGKGARSCRISLDYLALSDAFDMVQTGSPEGSVKPACIGAVLNRYGIMPENAVYIGDAPGDITAARQAGVGAVAAAWAETVPPEQLQALKPDAVCYSVEELTFYLKNFLGFSL